MREYNDPPKKGWPLLCRRPVVVRAQLDKVLDEVFAAVKNCGDSALREYTGRFDKVNIDSPRVPLGGINEESVTVSAELRSAIDRAYENIRMFHAAQMEVSAQKVQTQPGVVCWREARAIESVGLYIPGGTAPLISTVLMLGTPAQLAGCKEVVLCTPPGREGDINPALRYAAAKIGAKSLMRVGGIQAVAAMAIGTESVPRVSKIFGPGNQYVTAAKEYAQKLGVAMDMPAGPSEVMVIADDQADPVFVAADLLSQAEHGTDSQVVLVTDSRALIPRVKEEVARQLERLPRREIAAASLKASFCVSFPDMAKVIAFANGYAPEHLIVNTANPDRFVSSIQNAGSVFLGQFTPESAGDYASGTNHTLPTNGWARSYGGVSVDSFLCYITFQQISTMGLQNLAETITTLANAEGLQAHANAVTVRLRKK